MDILKKEMKNHLIKVIIPFWQKLCDEDYGGFYGYMDFDQSIDKKYEKGCILNSRILWFFSNAYERLDDSEVNRDELKKMADHAYEFLVKDCLDKDNGGVFWSLNYDGTEKDTTKHTYNQAFAIYALSSYYRISNNEQSIKIAYDLYNIIENKCRDIDGYLEAFDKEFNLIENDKLSENGVMAYRTMNTLLHVYEAYTEFYIVTKDEKVKDKLKWIMDLIEAKIYNGDLKRQEVFFDKDYNSLIDLHSYGHDIETAWLVDKGAEAVGDGYVEKMNEITSRLVEKVYEVAYTNNSLSNECEKGKVDTDRVWWVQAEAVVGFANEYIKTGNEKYKQAAYSIWGFIKEYLVDKRNNSEWFWLTDENGKPYENKPLVEPWKCPYHNGRMCMEIIKRI